MKHIQLVVNTRFEGGPALLFVYKNSPCSLRSGKINDGWRQFEEEGTSTLIEIQPPKYYQGWYYNTVHLWGSAQNQIIHPGLIFVDTLFSKNALNVFLRIQTSACMHAYINISKQGFWSLVSVCCWLPELFLRNELPMLGSSFTDVLGLYRAGPYDFISMSPVISLCWTYMFSGSQCHQS